MRRIATILAVACVALLAVAAIFAAGSWFARPAPGAIPVVSSDEAVTISDPDLAGDRPVASDPRAAQAGGDSLRDTAVDGAVRVDEHGQPVPDRQLRRLFDYFLTRSGEQTPEATRSALRAHLQSRVSAQALATVLAWFDAYLMLEHDSVTIAQADGDSAHAFARVRALRRERLGPALADAWYAEEEQAIELSDARRKLLAERGLSESERQRRLRDLDAAQPLRAELQAQTAQMDSTLQHSREYERAGTDPATRYAEREAQLGAQAAQRLGELDQRRAQWQLRLRSYAAQRQQVLADGALSETQRRERLNALLARFDANEQRRVDALTRNGMLPGK
ncbi:lipase secretion chaperone [Lysobacter sp. CA199]|uniref:lipase secretion chaperone n=1 Tax=Lysobacter sp. CA199 TaxID=3455608 RepID=UPI003F8D5012